LTEVSGDLQEGERVLSNPAARSTGSNPFGG
jgi:hypothetical protein